MTRVTKLTQLVRAARIAITKLMMGRFRLQRMVNRFFLVFGHGIVDGIESILYDERINSLNHDTRFAVFGNRLSTIPNLDDGVGGAELVVVYAGEEEVALVELHDKVV